MANPRPLPGQPGVFEDPDTGEKFAIKRARDDDVYDTVLVPDGAVTAGDEFLFFRDLQNKRRIDANIQTPGKLAAGEKLLLDNIGLEINLATGETFPNPSDVKRIAYNALYEFRLSGELIARGPVYKYPSGYGLAGQTQEAGQGIVSIGVASTAARAGLARKHLITGDRHEIEGRLVFEQRQWLAPDIAAAQQLPTLDNNVTVKNMLHGLRSEPATT